MKISRVGLAHAYSRAKNIGSQTWNHTQKVLQATDKLAYLGAKGLAALGDRLDPEVRQTAGRALQVYGQKREKMNNVTDNLGRINNAFKEVGWEL